MPAAVLLLFILSGCAWMAGEPGVQERQIKAIPETLPNQSDSLLSQFDSLSQDQNVASPALQVETKPSNIPSQSIPGSSQDTETEKPLPKFQSGVNAEKIPNLLSNGIIPDLESPADGILIIPMPDSLNRPVEVGLAEKLTGGTIAGVKRIILPQRQQQRSAPLSSVQFGISKGQIQLKSKINESFQETVCLSGDSTPLQWNSRSYPGILCLLSVGNRITLVNRVSVEEYLRGVVPHEIGTLEEWGIEALKAQAVAARTYAIKHLNSRRAQGFDVYADTRDQMYSGLNDSYALSDDAIRNTSGVVMAYEGELIDAYYHSTCGGMTASPAVWGIKEKPWLQAVSDFSPDGKPWCHRSSYTKWTRQWTLKELESIARRSTETARPDPLIAFNQIRDLRILSTFASGRVQELKVSTDNGSFLLSGDRIRWFFRDTKNFDRILPSAWFLVAINGNQVQASGRGFGHGIGMCQMGARGRSRAGQSYKEILKAYYTGIELVRFQ